MKRERFVQSEEREKRNFLSSFPYFPSVSLTVFLLILVFFFSLCLILVEKRLTEPGSEPLGMDLMVYIFPI